MGFLNKIFNKNKEKIKQETFHSPELNFKWECFACNDGIDPTMHKWTKQNGNYFHKKCWQKSLKLAKQKRVI